jgi:hypothetical protein
MADSSFMPAIIGLVGTSIGVILGLGGGLTTQLLLEHLRQRSEKKKKKAEKLEELVAVMHEYQHWLSKLRPYAADETADPVARIIAIGRVYFPEFEKSIWRVTVNGANYKVRKLDTGVEQKEKDSAFQEYLAAHLDLLKAIDVFAKREFQ